MIYKWRELTQNFGYAICSTGAYGAMARHRGYGPRQGAKLGESEDMLRRETLIM